MDSYIHTYIHIHSLSYSHLQSAHMYLHTDSHSFTLKFIHPHITKLYTLTLTRPHSHIYTDLPSLVHEYQFGLTHSHFHTLRHFRACFHTYAHSHSLSLLTPYTLIHTLTQSSHCHSHTGPLTLSPHRREKELGPLLISREVSGIFQETPIPT